MQEQLNDPFKINQPKKRWNYRPKKRWNELPKKRKAASLVIALLIIGAIIAVTVILVQKKKDKTPQASSQAPTLVRPPIVGVSTPLLLPTGPIVPAELGVGNYPTGFEWNSPEYGSTISNNSSRYGIRISSSGSALITKNKLQKRAFAWDKDANGAFIRHLSSMLSIEPTGNVVMYDTSATPNVAYWQTGTTSDKPVALSFDTHGMIFLHPVGDFNTVLWKQYNVPVDLMQAGGASEFGIGDYVAPFLLEDDYGYLRIGLDGVMSVGKYSGAGHWRPLGLEQHPSSMLSVQADGNVVWYDTSVTPKKALWMSNTSYSSPVALSFDARNDVLTLHPVGDYNNVLWKSTVMKD